jgi:hypothetical protein
MNKIIATLTVAGVLAASSALAVQPVTTALTLSNVIGDGSNGSYWTLGWSFSVNSQIDVTALGVYDSGQNGLTEDHAVGLWDASGNLLASTIVPAGGGTLDNYFVFEPINGVVLDPGNYVVGARMEDEAYNPFSVANPDITTAPEITYLINLYIDSGGLDFPTGSLTGTVGYFGGDFQFVPVPEPSQIEFGALMLIGAAGNAIRRRLAK